MWPWEPLAINALFLRRDPCADHEDVFHFLYQANGTQSTANQIYPFCLLKTLHGGISTEISTPGEASSNTLVSIFGYRAIQCVDAVNKSSTMAVSRRKNPTGRYKCSLRCLSSLQVIMQSTALFFEMSNILITSISQWSQSQIFYTTSQLERSPNVIPLVDS